MLSNFSEDSKACECSKDSVNIPLASIMGRRLKANKVAALKNFKCTLPESQRDVLRKRTKQVQPSIETSPLSETSQRSLLK